MDYIICCSIDGLDEEQSKMLKEMGLIDKHAYSMIGVKDLGFTRICQIRNPWGSFEWNGDWGDNSDLWTDDIKE
jgi:calpain-15